MKTKFITFRWLFVFAITFLCVAFTASAADMKLEAQLIWGTNEAKSPDPKHKSVDDFTAKKLQSLPFKWSHYFVVNSKELTVAEGDEATVRLSKDCTLKIKNVGRSQVELTLYGKDKAVGKITQALPKGELLVTGGNAENSTAWFVALKQVD